jgi:hypothetical protein
MPSLFDYLNVKEHNWVRDAKAQTTISSLVYSPWLACGGRQPIKVAVILQIHHRQLFKVTEIVKE